MESLEPLWGNVCLKLDEPDEKSEGGIWIPEPSREMKLSGTVMAAGSGRIDVQGIFHPSNLKPGDKVMFGRHLGYKVPVNGEKYYMCMEKHIEAVVGEPEELAVLGEPDPNVQWEYITVDIEDWKSAGNLGVVSLYESEHWVPHSVIKGTNTLRQFRRNSVAYWQEYHREREAMNGILNDPAFVNAAHVGVVEALNPCQPTVTVPEEALLGDSNNYEYKIINITCYTAEPNSPEEKELERYQKAGWEVHEAEANLDCLRVTSLRRLIK